MSSSVKRISKSGKKSYHEISVGKRRREIKKNDKPENVAKAFSRRKETLLRKAMDMEVSTGATVEMRITAPSGTVYTYGKNETAPVLQNEAVVDESNAPMPVQDPSTSDKEVQTNDSMGRVLDVNKCRVCGEGELDRRVIWVGCSFKACDVWVHAECIGIFAKTNGAISRMKWFCIGHRGLKK